MEDILLSTEILQYTTYNLKRDNLVLLDTVNSTNLYCKQLAKTKPCHEILIVANTQTSGKGRMGRVFFSPQNTGIYMSLLLDSKCIVLSPKLLTVAAGVAVCRVLRNICKTDASIKWVNDIFVNGKKACGILAESVCSTNETTHQYIIVGIGINISTPDNIFPDEIKSIAGSVFPNRVSRNEIIAKIFNELRDLYMKNNPDELIKEYKSHSCVLGKEIGFTQNNKVYTGIADDINNEGNLVVRLSNNETLTLKSGEVSLGSNNFANKTV